MNIEEAKLYLEHTSKDDFNLEEHQKENRYQAIQVVLKEIERLNNIIEDFEIELQREINVREEDTSLEHNTFIIIQNTLKTALKRFRELKGSSNNE